MKYKPLFIIGVVKHWFTRRRVDAENARMQADCTALMAFVHEFNTLPLETQEDAQAREARGQDHAEQQSA